MISYGATDQGTCEVLVSDRWPGDAMCGTAATMRYPSMGGGYMRLCSEHGAKHASYCERWDRGKWLASPVEEKDQPTSDEVKQG